MAMYYDGKKVRNLYFNGKCITRLALGKEMTRLVEGDDFVRAQWIERIGSAYISIPINLWQNRFDMCIQTTENYTYFNTYSETNPNGRCFMTYNWGGGNPYVLIAFREGGASHIYDLRFSQALSSNTISIFQKDGVATGIINGIEYQDTGLVESSWNYDIECQVPLGKTQYFKVYNGDGTYRSNLAPCRLLRPIPATLDANGIARNAGECGMYDAVSGKFYGNVANSGAFTVEPNLVEGVDYERHRWLKGDGSAYIDTGVTSYNGVVDIKLSVGSFNGTIFGRTLGNDGDYSKRFFVGRYTSYGIYGNNQAPSTLIVNDSVLLTIDIDNSIATDNYGNTTSISIIGNVVGNSMYLFCANKDNVPATPIFNGKIGLFNISSIINLIPVRLLRPLPAYLDANGKARKQFECGMLDLETMKFYGNVANSGNFTVSDN